MTLQYNSKELFMAIMRQAVPHDYMPFGSLPVDLEDRFKQPHLVSAETSRSDECANDVRVSSWNVRYTTHIDDVLHALVKKPDLTNSDIVALQEVAVADATARARLQEEIARSIGFSSVYGTEFLKFDGRELVGEIGNMVLSRHKVVYFSIVRVAPGAYAYSNRGNEMFGSNMAVKAGIIKDGKQIVAYSAHLELTSPRRYRRLQMQRLLQDTAGHNDAPILIAGDFNLLTESQRSKTMKDVKEGGFTDPFGDKRQRTVNGNLAKHLAPILGGKAVLDRILSRGFVLSYSKIHYTVKVSDHYPITAVYRFA